MARSQIVILMASWASLFCISLTSAMPSRFSDVISQENQSPSTLENPAYLSPEECPSSQFWSQLEFVCKPCSVCPRNQIIRRPCSALQDTWCGPFLEFHKFNQASSKQDSESDGQDPTAQDRQKNDHNNSKHTEEGPAEPESEPDLTSVHLHKTRSQWRTLSFALIAVLTFISLLVIAVGLYAGVVCRRSRTHKHLLRETEILVTYPDPDTEPRYVQTYVTLHDPLRSSRHLPIYRPIYTGNRAPLVLASSPAVKESARTETDRGEDQYMYLSAGQQ